MIVWPGLRRSVSAISRLFNSASFAAPLTHSAIPTRAASGTTATFTRATTATVRDNEGVLRTCLAGEARFEGARRVRNLLSTTSENFSNVVWSKTGSTSVTGTNVLNFPVAVEGVTQVLSPIPASGSKLVLSAKLSAPVAGTFSLRYYDGTSIFVQQFNLTTTPTEYSFALTTGAVGDARFYLFRDAADTATQVTCEYAQVEDVTAQTTQTAGEYVSVGVTSAPYYHGSFVDGVKCFATDINGAAIPSTTLLGYLAEGVRTNLCRYSQSIAAGFTFSGTCTGTDNVGTYAGVPFTRINAATGGVSYIACSYTGDGTKAFSCLLKKDGAVTGTYSVGFYDNSASVVRGYVTATIAADGGMTFAANGGCTVTGSRELADGVWELQGTVAGIVASNVNIYYANFAVGTATSCLVSAMQTENASFPSTYIATTTVAATRNADVLTYPSAGNIDGTKGACYSDINLNSIDTASNNWVVVRDNDKGILYSNGTDGQVVIFDGIQGAVKSGLGTFVRTQTKIASTWGGSAQAVTGDGLTPATAAFDGSLDPVATIGIGANGTGYLWGHVRNVRIWNRALSNSELQGVTSA